jgi:uncharacterized protein YecT (DUF1311 family)
MKLKEMAATATLAAGMMASGVAMSTITASFPAEIEVVAQTQETATSNGGHSDDESDDLPKTYWQTFKPQFRDSFHTQWRAAKTDEEKLAAIKEELAYQDKLMNDRYKELHAIMTEKDWEFERDEQREWLAEIISVCDDDSDGDRVGAADCRLYRTAVRASELHVGILLERDHH